MSNLTWSKWRPAEQCKGCGYTCPRMVVHGYTCPECGLVDNFPKEVAVRAQYKLILGGLMRVPTGVTETKAKP